MAVLLTSAVAFAKVIAEPYPTSGLTVVDFFSLACPPCRRIAPVFDNLASLYMNSVRFGKVDTDQCRDIASACNITTIPTFIFFRYGNQVDRISGADEDLLSSKIAEHSFVAPVAVQEEVALYVHFPLLVPLRFDRTQNIDKVLAEIKTCPTMTTKDCHILTEAVAVLKDTSFYHSRVMPSGIDALLRRLIGGNAIAIDRRFPVLDFLRMLFLHPNYQKFNAAALSTDNETILHCLLRSYISIDIVSISEPNSKAIELNRYFALCCIANMLSSSLLEYGIFMCASTLLDALDTAIVKRSINARTMLALSTVMLNICVVLSNRRREMRVHSNEKEKELLDSWLDETGLRWRCLHLTVKALCPSIPVQLEISDLVPAFRLLVGIGTLLENDDTGKTVAKSSRIIESVDAVSCWATRLDPGAYNDDKEALIKVAKELHHLLCERPNEDPLPNPWAQSG